MMLAPVSSGRADPKKWFHSPEGDAFFWTAPDGGVASFQVTCFSSGESRREWWVEWDGRVLRAGLVDSKEVDSRAHDIRSPTVDVSDDPAGEAARRVRDFVEREGDGLPPAYRGFVIDKLKARA